MLAKKKQKLMKNISKKLMYQDENYMNIDQIAIQIKKTTKI